MEQVMRYQVKLDGRYKVIDTHFDDTLICHTGNKLKAELVAADLNARFSTAPRPVALQALQTSMQADAEERLRQLVEGNVSVEKSLSHSEWLVNKRATRGESYRIDGAA
jgi:hypothetical protein